MSLAKTIAALAQCGALAVCCGCGRHDAEPRTYVESAPPPAPSSVSMPAAMPPGMAGHAMPPGMAGHGGMPPGMGTGGMPPGMAGPAMAPQGPVAPLAWIEPAGWSKHPGPGQGMRRATFEIPFAAPGTGSVECALSLLPGAAGGGLAPNVMRWAGQLELAVPQDKLRAFVDGIAEQKSAGGDPLYLVDFGVLLEASAAADTPCMLAAMVRRTNDCVFVKLVAPRATLAAEKARFEALARSIK